MPMSMQSKTWSLVHVLMALHTIVLLILAANANWLQLFECNNNVSPTGSPYNNNHHNRNFNKEIRKLSSNYALCCKTLNSILVMTMQRYFTQKMVESRYSLLIQYDVVLFFYSQNHGHYSLENNCISHLQHCTYFCSIIWMMTLCENHKEESPRFAIICIVGNRHAKQNQILCAHVS